MSNYNAIEKQQIMLQTDLLDNPLTVAELGLLQELYREELLNDVKLRAMPLTESVKDKIANLLNQGMKLGFELEKLDQRGVSVLFSLDNEITKTILARFKKQPKLLFTVGSKSLLLDPNIKLVTTYPDVIATNEAVVFITDRGMNDLLRYPDISNRLINGTLVLLADTYRSKSKIKEVPKESKKIVFISGSRTQEEIPESVMHSLSLIQQQQLKIVIGDSEKGVDNEIVDFLRLAPKYPYVEIYTIKPKPRVKVEKEWQIKVIETEGSLKPQEKQMVKDRAMADVANWGLVIFNPITKNRYGAIQVSAGTLRNTVQMLLEHKAVKFFYVYEGEVKTDNLRTITDLKKIIEIYKEEQLTLEEKNLIQSAKGVNRDSNFSIVKFQKIKQKLDELLKKELKLKEEIDHLSIGNKLDQTRLF